MIRSFITETTMVATKRDEWNNDHTFPQCLGFGWKEAQHTGDAFPPMDCPLAAYAALKISVDGLGSIAASFDEWDTKAFKAAFLSALMMIANEARSAAEQLGLCATEKE
jgi:hypothetical protein